MENNHEKPEEITEPSFYAIIPAFIRYNEKLSPNEKLLYGEITALCNQRGYCFASNSYFAKLYKVHKNTVSRWISSLEDQKVIITFDYINGHTTHRRIRLEGINENVNPPKQNDLPPFTKTSRGINENVNHNNTINTTSSNTANTDKIKIGSASFFDIAAYINTEAGQAIYKAVTANLKDTGIAEDEFLADLKQQYPVYAFKDENHVINALKKRIEFIGANKKKGKRGGNSPTQSGMVY